MINHPKQNCIWAMSAWDWYGCCFLSMTEPHQASLLNPSCSIHTSSSSADALLKRLYPQALPQYWQYCRILCRENRSLVSQPAKKSGRKACFCIIAVWRQELTCSRVSLEYIASLDGGLVLRFQRKTLVIYIKRPYLHASAQFHRSRCCCICSSDTSLSTSKLGFFQSMIEAWISSTRVKSNFVQRIDEAFSFSSARLASCIRGTTSSLGQPTRSKKLQYRPSSRVKRVSK